MVWNRYTVQNTSQSIIHTYVNSGDRGVANGMLCEAENRFAEQGQALRRVRDLPLDLLLALQGGGLLPRGSQWVPSACLLHHMWQPGWLEGWVTRKVGTFEASLKPVTAFIKNEIRSGCNCVSRLGSP